MTEIPRVHLNGTAGDVLAHEYYKATEAIMVAVRLCHDITVHGRDYYPIDNKALERALLEHHDRIERLRAVREELITVMLGINDQIHGYNQDEVEQ